MGYKRALTIQDISCFGQCSLTVALSVISACGTETCVLPSAVLSTHTSGFKGYTCLDMTDEMKKILAHWAQLDIRFDAIYTGYLATAEQIDIVKGTFGARLKDGGLKIVDPVMGDFGKLYPAFDMDFVGAMKELCSVADVILPNVTEACLLTGKQYKFSYDEGYIDDLLDGLKALGAKKIVLTGVGYDDKTTGVVVYDGEIKRYYKHAREDRSCHGTGDIFASAFTGSLLAGEDEYGAAKLAADFVVDCIKHTPNDGSHPYGVRFESCLKALVQKL